MLWLIAMIPLTIFGFTVISYRFQGKREVLRFDLVQFLYAFVFSPLLFIWLKAVLFFLLQHNGQPILPPREMFVYDAVLGILFLYVYAFVVIHSLTKTFQLKVVHDPLYDLFGHSEYYHWGVSHAVIYAGGMVALTAVSLLNIFFPFATKNSHFTLIGIMLLGALIGFIAASSMMFFSQSAGKRFVRGIRFSAIFCVLIHLFSFFLFDISFSLSQGLYWMSTTTFVVVTLCSFVFTRSERAHRMLHRMHRIKSDSVPVLEKKTTPRRKKKRSRA